MVLGGSVGQMHGLKIYEAIERALQMRVPCIGCGCWGGRILKLDDIERGAHDISMEGNERGGIVAIFRSTQASGMVTDFSHHGVLRWQCGI